MYEEVHERVGDARLHERNLSRLAQALGGNCEPVPVTDAGSRGWWYEQVRARVWYYVGRVKRALR